MLNREGSNFVLVGVLPVVTMINIPVLKESVPKQRTFLAKWDDVQNLT